MFNNLNIKFFDVLVIKKNASVVKLIDTLVLRASSFGSPDLNSGRGTKFAT